MKNTMPLARLEFNDVIVSTIWASDARCYETAVKVGEAPWVIVETYDLITLAHQGHARWTEKVREGQRDFVECRSEEEQRRVVTAFYKELDEIISKGDENPWTGTN